MVSFNDVTVGQLRAGAAELSGGGDQLADKSVIHAKVIDYGGGKALLEINGKMVSAETDVPLKQNGEFDLIVRGQEQGGKLSLQVIGAREAASSSVTPLTDRMISSRLLSFDLPDHEASVPSAKALISNGIAVTKATMEAMLMALPRSAPQNVIDFAASLMREGLPVTREIVALAADVAQALEKIPLDMKAAVTANVPDGESAAVQKQANDLQTLNAKANTEDVSIVKNNQQPSIFENMADEDAAVIAEKLPSATKVFMSSIESRLQAFIEAAVSHSAENNTSAKLVDLLTSLIKIIPEAAEQDGSSAHILKAAANIVALIEDVDIDSPEAAKIRDAFVNDAKQILRESDSPEKLVALRESALRAITAAISGIQEPTSENFKPAPLFSNMFQELYNEVSSALKTVQQYVAPTEISQGSTSVIKPETMDVLNILARLLSFKISGENMEALKEFISTGTKWTTSTLDEISTKLNTDSQPATAGSDAAAKEAARNELMDSMKMILRSPEFARELSVLSSLAKDASGPHASLLQNASSSASQQSSDIMRSVQLVNLANTAQHTGIEPMNYYVSYFPFKVGSHNGVGKLKVFRREGEDRNKNKSNKPLNPFDATIALILDTEHLGISSITLKTFVDKSLDCEIELEDKKRTSFVSKYSEELSKDLENTAYERNRVRITERKRDKNNRAQTPDKENETKFTSVDMRV